MQSKNDFYNRYHNKNSKFFSIINDNNFTYYFHLRQLITILPKMGKESNILDIGCGVGTLAYYLASKGFNVIGVDVSSRAIKIANSFRSKSGLKNVNFSLGDVQMITSTRKYDLIVCTEVIEHLENDVKMLKTIYTLLNSKGKLLLSTPSVNAPLYKLGMLRKFDLEVGHLRRYKMDDLLFKLRKSGFRIVSERKNESILRNSLFTFKKLGILIKPIKGPLVPIFHWIDDLLTVMFGESDLMVIAEKP